MGSSPPLVHPPSPTTPFPCPPRTSREASSLSSSLGKSREGREGAQAICGTQKVAQQQQQDGEEQWSGKLVKRFFSPAYSSICWPGTGPTRRQADNQESSYPPLVILTFSNSLRTPDQGKLRSIRAQCRSIYQDDEACLAIGVVDTHMHCTVHTTTQTTQTQSKEEQQIKCSCCNRFKH